ncbi:MAG: hypothetical protein EHM28_02155 [Spirochaetaceae bacterium]|nr:MAG: hypothetical protein EHM28_02155 [Spirochaetaceae bacterium]
MKEMLKKPVFVEFIGMPGSGKTTLSHCAAGILREKGMKIEESTYHINDEMKSIQRYMIKTWYTIKLVILKPSWAITWISLIIKSRQNTLKDLILMIINCFYILEIYRNGMLKYDIYFLDQGILQALVSLNYEANGNIFNEKNLAHVLQFISNLTLRIVFVEIDDNSIAQRLKRRDKKQSRMESGKNSNDFMNIIHEAKIKMDKICTIIFKELKQTEVLTVNNPDSNSYLTAANNIADLL